MIKLCIQKKEYVNPDNPIKCSICGRTGWDSGIELGLFASGTTDIVCYECGQRTDPKLVQLLELVRNCELKVWDSGIPHREDTPMAEAKFNKLIHYSNKPLTKFSHFDGFAKIDAENSISPDQRPDEDGDDLWETPYAEELMSGGYAVRILVPEGTSQEVATRLIKKLLNWITNANLFNPPKSKTNSKPDDKPTGTDTHFF
jgi:hypothetical protein